MKILLLGSGELGKEFTIAVKRYGHYVVAADFYLGAPAMQMADEFRVLDMLDATALDAMVADVKPDIIVPEIEAIRTECFYAYEEQGIHVVPSAKAANMTMNRKAIREFVARELNLKTPSYLFATTEDEFIDAIQQIGMPCVVKPLMSSSGKGQSVVYTAAVAQQAWTYAMEGSRGDLREVIVEEFIPFESEITLLTVTQSDGPTRFCPPIGHTQERGDYQESWMPHPISPELLAEAQRMAGIITHALTGAGIWGVEFFLTDTEVYFSELSPRPHDTGLVTLGGCIPLSEFELHARAVLGYPIPEQLLSRAAASAVILAREAHEVAPVVKGLRQALTDAQVEVRIFGKSSTHRYRRMGVAVAWGTDDVDALRIKAKTAAACIDVG